MLAGSSLILNTKAEQSEVIKLKEHYEPFLDGLRGALAIWVFVFHAAAFSGFWTWLIPPGAFAVDGFMFLSGFLMTRNFIVREKAEPLANRSTIIRFFIRRVFRIAPLYYLLLTVAYLCAPQYNKFSEVNAAFPPPWVDAVTSNPSHSEITGINVLAHVSFLFGLFPQYASNAMLPDWSLSLEMQFYVAIPFIMLLARRIDIVLLSLVLLVVQTIVRHHIGLYLSPKEWGFWPQPSMLAFKITCFMSGVLLAMYLSHRRPLIVALFFTVAFVGQAYIFAAISIFSFLASANLDRKEGLVASSVTLIKNVLSHPISRFFGDISYGVYLIHILVLLPVLHILLKMNGFAALSSWLRFTILVALTVICVVPCAALLHWLVELPGIAAGRRLARMVPLRKLTE